jgi:hypothetical protein
MGRFEHQLIKPILETFQDVIPKVTKGIAEGQARYAKALTEAADAFEHTDKNHVSTKPNTDVTIWKPSPDGTGSHLNKGGDTVLRRWSPAHEAGPLGEGYPANTFQGASYDEVVLAQETKMYRVVNDTSNPSGGFWTREKPAGPLQSQLDSALLPEWKLVDPAAPLKVTDRQATHYVEATMPKGTTIFEGAAGHQVGTVFPGTNLVGGGQQVYISKVKNDWLLGDRAPDGGLIPRKHRLAP